mmetsp:Transcript_45839/g.74790  ORF Transcript_45839/g.74790 Transcript_45839/m.74790 type:complete len:203 (-) Transcript_45839:96-704(-)
MAPTGFVVAPVGHLTAEHHFKFGSSCSRRHVSVSSSERRSSSTVPSRSFFSGRSLQAVAAFVSVCTKKNPSFNTVFKKLANKSIASAERNEDEDFSVDSASSSSNKSGQVVFGSFVPLMGATIIGTAFANFLQIYVFLLTVRIVLTWIPSLEGSAPVQALSSITDPYLGLFRGIIPPVGGLDLSPFLAFLLLQFMQSISGGL